MDDFENGCIPTHWQTRMWREDLLFLSGTGGDFTLYGHIKTAEQRDSNTVTGTLAVDGLAVTFGTARRGLDGLRPQPVHAPPRHKVTYMHDMYFSHICISDP